MSPTQPTGDSLQTGRAPRPSRSRIDSQTDDPPGVADPPHASNPLHTGDPFAGVVE